MKQPKGLRMPGKCSRRLVMMQWLLLIAMAFQQLRRFLLPILALRLPYWQRLKIPRGHYRYVKFGLDILIKWKRSRKFLDKSLEAEKKIPSEATNTPKTVSWVCITLIASFTKLAELLKLLTNTTNFVGFGPSLRWKRRKSTHCAT